MLDLDKKQGESHRVLGKGAGGQRWLVTDSRGRGLMEPSLTTSPHTLLGCGWTGSVRASAPEEVAASAGGGALPAPAATGLVGRVLLKWADQSRHLRQHLRLRLVWLERGTGRERERERAAC